MRRSSTHGGSKIYLVTVFCWLLIMVVASICSPLCGQLLPAEGRVQQRHVSQDDSLQIHQKIKAGVDTMNANRDIAWQYFSEAEKRARNVGSKYLYADVLLQEAVLLYYEDKYETAINSCLLAATYFSETKDTLKEGRCYANLGLLYQYVGDYAASLKSLFKGLNLCQFTSGNSDLKGSFYTNISLLYSDLGDYDNALSYALKGEKNQLAQKDTADLAGVYNTIGEIYKNKNELDRSKAYFKKAISYHQLAGDLTRTMQSIANLAQVYMKNNEIDSALYYQAKTIDYATRNKDQEFASYCQTITTYGYMLAASGQSKLASQYLSACQSCKPLLTNLGYAINYYSFLYQYYKSIGRLDLALVNMEKLSEVNEHLAVESRKFENQRTALRYEFDTKAREDSLQYQLKISKQEIKTAAYKNRVYLLLVVILVLCGLAIGIIKRIRKSQQEKRRSAMEAMRNAIATDLHDDIGSTLSSIQIISSIALKQCADNAPLKLSIGQISSLSDKVSNGIREIVWSVNPAHDKLKSIIDLMRKLAAEILGPSDIRVKFQQKIEAGEKLISPAIRKDFLMIFKEAINNARKYSGSRQVDISVHQEGNLISLQIKDYGSGFDVDCALKGNGLNNMRKRADAMGARLSMHTRPGNGTFLCLKLPLP